MKALHLYRLLPLAGWLANLLRYPGLRCGLRVEIEGPGEFKFGADVSLGERTRIELAAGKLARDRRRRHGQPRRASRAAQENCRIADRSGHDCAGRMPALRRRHRWPATASLRRTCSSPPARMCSTRCPHRPIQEQESSRRRPSGRIRIYGDCWFGINVVITPRRDSRARLRRRRQCGGDRRSAALSRRGGQSGARDPQAARIFAEAPNRRRQ